MGKCKLILKPSLTLASRASKNQAELIKSILKQNVKKGMVPAHEEAARSARIESFVKEECIVRVVMRVVSDM